MFAQGIYLILQFIQAKHKQKGSLEPLFQKKKKKIKTQPPPSLIETILRDGLCPRERHRLEQPSFCGGTPCPEHSLIHKDKYFTWGLTNWNKVSNSGKTNNMKNFWEKKKTNNN